MFVMIVSYKVPLNEIDKHIEAHRAFLDEGYQKNYFLASGPQNPRVGGVILSQLADRDFLEKILQQDPFIVFDVAHYQIIEFIPNKQHPNFYPQ